MKYKLSKEVEFVPEWNDNDKLPEAEQIKFVLKVLSMGDVIELMDTLEDSGLSGDVDNKDLDSGTTKKLILEAVRLLPVYASMVGLEDEGGAEITVANITEFPQFIGLITEVLFKLINISTPQEEDVKNSNGLSA